MSPTQRTLGWLKKNEIPAGIVERWIGPAKRRVDLFGFIDLVAIYPDSIVGIQVTSGSHHADHKRKILDSPQAPMWLHQGRIELWSWSKKKVKRAGKAVRWIPRIENITLESFERDGEISEGSNCNCGSLSDSVMDTRKNE